MSQKPTKRKVSGQFAPGSGHGGARSGAGRKPNTVRKALDAILTEPCALDPEKRPLIDIAAETIYEALICRMRTKGGELVVPKAALAAAIDVWNRKYGKPKQTHEVNLSGGWLIDELKGGDAAAASSKEA